MRIATVVLLATAVVMPARAQTGPSFDCSKASTAVEKAICARPELAKADRAMAAAYNDLAGKLTGAAKEHLIKDQTQWIASRNRACTGGAEEIARCLRQRYEARLENLKAFGQDAYPFIGEQTLFKEGKVGKVSYTIDASWPQFDGTTADFSAFNRHLADLSRKAGDEAIPDRKAGAEAPFDQIWTYDQRFTLQRPSPDAVAVAVKFYGYTGGAHGMSGTTAYLVDLRSGRAVPPGAVFAKGDAWLTTLVPLVRADLKKQFDAGKPGFDDALEPDKLAKLLREPDHYYYRRGKLELIFDAYVVGPYAAGPYTVDIPYATLKPLLAADGPLGTLR